MCIYIYMHTSIIVNMLRKFLGTFFVGNLTGTFFEFQNLNVIIRIVCSDLLASSYDTISFIPRVM